jgi:hypothetical protein
VVYIIHHIKARLEWLSISRGLVHNTPPRLPVS